MSGDTELITVEQVWKTLNVVQSAYGVWLVLGASRHNEYDAAWKAAQKLIERLVAAQVAPAERAGVCVWYQTEDGEYWHGQCGTDWNFTTSQHVPSDPHLRFCPQCGRPAVIQPEPDDREEE